MDDTNFQDAKEYEIECYMFELAEAEEMTVTLTRKEWDELCYACAHAEMMWRKRSHNPAIDSHGSYEDPDEFEITCRAEMKKYRELQKKLAATVYEQTA